MGTWAEEVEMEKFEPGKVRRIFTACHIPWMLNLPDIIIIALKHTRGALIARVFCDTNSSGEASSRKKAMLLLGIGSDHSSSCSMIVANCDVC
jgi:hypothetical protein